MAVQKHIFLLLFWLFSNHLHAQISLKGQILDSQTNLPVPCSYSLVETESGKILKDTLSADGAYIVFLKPDVQYNVIFKAAFYEFMGITFRINKSASRNFMIDPLREGSIGNIGELAFEQSKAELSVESEATLNLLLDWLKAHPKIAKIEIRGHTDKVGDPLQNMKLSRMRAEAVANFIASHGFSKEKIVVNGYGSMLPLEATSNPKNRRVEIKILSVEK